MPNIKARVLLVIISLMLGVGFSGAAVNAAGLWEAQTSRSWLLASNNANQASLWGRAPGSWFGGTLASGDINGDGYDDLITSARFESTTVQAGGDVYVIPGPLAFNSVYTMPQPAALVFQGLSGDQPQLGVYLDSGDMNGDGIDDIVMGSWTTDKTYVYLGRPNIRASTPLTIPVSPDNMALTISPVGSGQVLCDFNGDGYQDLFGEQLIDYGGYTGVQVWGVLGSSALTSTHPLTRSLPTDADIVIKEFHPVSWGSPNSKNMACGDIDGDGIPDLAIGIYGDSPGNRASAGAVYIVRGNRAITAGHPVTLTMPDQAGAIIEGVDGDMNAGGDFLGETIASADINHDGHADLILSAPHASGAGMWLTGKVYLWLGRSLTGQRFVVSSQRVFLKSILAS